MNARNTVHRTDPPGTVVPPLVKAAQALRSADQEWVGLSTLTRASHEFLSESRRLLAVLKGVAVLANSADHGEFDHQRSASDLAAVANSVSDLTALTQDLPSRLLRSHLLFANAQRLVDPLQRLNRRPGRGAVPLNPNDAPNLQARWAEAALAATTAAQSLDSMPLPRPVDRSVPQVADRR